MLYGKYTNVRNIHYSENLKCFQDTLSEILIRANYSFVSVFSQSREKVPESPGPKLRSIESGEPETGIKGTTRFKRNFIRFTPPPAFVEQSRVGHIRSRVKVSLGSFEEVNVSPKSLRGRFIPSHPIWALSTTSCHLQGTVVL